MDQGVRLVSLGGSMVSCLLALALAGPAEDEVRALLATDDRTDFSRSPWEEDAEVLRAGHGASAFELVAAHLGDAEVGWSAAHTLLVLDADRALPRILDAAPSADRNVQRLGLERVLRDWEERRDLGDRERAAAAARGVLALGDRGHADAQIPALLVLGLAGGLGDLAVVEPWRQSAHPTEPWRIRLRASATVAAVRLGSEQALSDVDRVLSQAAERAEVDLEAVTRTHELVAAARFAGSPALVGPLCALLDHPLPARDGHVVAPSIPHAAATALRHLAADGARGGEGPLGDDPAAWRGWCAKR